MLEDGTFRITSEQLLANASDVDGDTLSVVDLKLAKGEGSISSNADGSWTFAPAKDWNGVANFSYGVSDGTAMTNAVEEGSAPPQADRYLSLSGISQQYAVINHSDSLAINGEITISSWVYRNDDGSDWRNLYDIPGAHLLEFSPSGGFDFRAENNNIDFNVNGPSIPKDTWTLITATMRKVADGQYSADVFVNGELIANAPNWQLGDQNNSSGVRSSEQDLFLGLLQSQTPWNGDPLSLIHI